jgi:hypothetical protein
VALPQLAGAGGLRRPPDLVGLGGGRLGRGTRAMNRRRRGGDGRKEPPRGWGSRRGECASRVNAWRGG